jgi:hypothetical protein
VKQRLAATGNSGCVEYGEGRSASADAMGELVASGVSAPRSSRPDRLHTNGALNCEDRGCKVGVKRSWIRVGSSAPIRLSGQRGNAVR